MRLKNATALAIAAICVLFLTKTAATLHVDLFGRLAVARVAILLTFFSSVVMVYFYYCFYRDYVRPEQTTLKSVAGLAIIGSLAVALIHLKGLLLVFDVFVTVPLFRSHMVAVVVPWLCSIIVLVFFGVFYNEVQTDKGAGLRRAILFAAIGAAIGVLERTLVMYVALKSTDVTWFSDLSTATQLAFLPVIALGVAAILYFFVVFYKEQHLVDSESK
jgi:hypothetical protein